MRQLANVGSGIVVLAIAAAAFLAMAGDARAANVCGSRQIWINDVGYGTPGGGVYWDPLSSKVWTPERGWHYFAPDPARPSPEPLWVNQLDYGSRGGGFYWDPVSGQVWTAEQGWHVYGRHGCGLAPGSGGLTLRSGPSRPVPPLPEPVSSPGAELLSAEFVFADCEGTCRAIRITIDAAYTLDNTHEADDLTIRFVPLLIYGRCLTAGSGPSEGLQTGTGSALAKSTLTFQGCTGENVLSDEIYGLAISLERADGTSGNLARITVPFYAHVDFVRQAPPTAGTITLMDGDSFDFFTGVRGTAGDGEFYYTDNPGEGDQEFWANNLGQRGLVDVGNVPIESAPIPGGGYNRFGVAAILGHTYVSLVAEGYEGKHVVFRVIALNSVGVTLQWVIR